jgi:hypothetical protein
MKKSAGTSQGQSAAELISIRIAALGKAKPSKKARAR